MAEVGLGPNSVIVQSANVLAVGVGDDVVIMNAEVGRYYGLDDISSAIWKQLVKPQTILNLVNVLSQEYDADQEAIMADIMPFIARMMDSGLICCA